MKRLILFFGLVGLLLGFGGEVFAQSCGGGAVYCTAAPCTCTDLGASNSCVCSASDCRPCGAGWLPCGETCTNIYDDHTPRNIIGENCVTNTTACTNASNQTSCPGWIDPCCNVSGCDGGGGGGGGGGDGEAPDPTPAVTHSECIGNSCTTVSGSGANQCNVDADCTISYSVSGTVRLGSATWNGTDCVSGSGSGVLPGVNSLVRVNSTGLTQIQADGTYATSASGGTNVFTLIPTDATYIATCPPAGIYSRNVTANITNLDFYVTTQQIPWWQTRGGDVGANGGSIATNIPGTCVGACKPFVSLYDALLTPHSSGVVWMNALTGNFGTAGSNFSEGTDYRAYNASMRTLTKREGYEYFYRLFEMGLNPTEDVVLSSNEANMIKPDTTLQAPTNGRAYFVRAGDGTGSVTIGTPWTLVPGESVVVFVDGDLVIDQPITTAVGDFIAFIVSGDITFNLGNAAPSLVTPNVQGVFIADGQIVTSAASEQFVGQGMFIGWGGVDMNRDFGDNTSNTNPSEFFSYRPDFVTNAPARMKRPVIRWEEVAP